MARKAQKKSVAEATVRLALPSKGQLEEPTLEFLERCGLRVSKTNPRQYLGRMPAMPEVEVLFQRPADVFSKVRDGDAALGITGFDVVAEGQPEGGEVLVLYESLGLGGCELVLAVPDGWLDVNCIADLADLALTHRDQGRPLRVATKYPNLVREFFYSKGITHFSLVESQGAMEAAPAIGYADLIADITATGTTLRENRLKQLEDGTIIHSEACLIGHRSTLYANQRVLNIVGHLLEMIEAYERGKGHLAVRANIPCGEPARIAAQVSQLPAIAGLRGPGISMIYDSNGDCIAVTVSVIVRKDQMRQVVSDFRRIGGTEIIVSPVTYIFGSASEAFRRLQNRLGKGGQPAGPGSDRE